ncbi:LysM peptidoglycan-binding domain-containing protein [Lysobacter sp. K5869]|uniref:LysM peptidoglycan-binding domain-containing protein n=1 Tax=Lysobacter sp. K5869 TaxID=2820808 RepID=UPI001C0621FD|nr:LysM domain-containing protein [Lysobacter sp. K5869]QWP75384.1 LysM peptidoglycan-binding domain-containing protein [Lysobacter sp. K5869]
MNAAVSPSAAGALPTDQAAQGETLGDLAVRHGVSSAAILRANPELFREQLMRDANAALLRADSLPAPGAPLAIPPQPQSVRERVDGPFVAAQREFKTELSGTVSESHTQKTATGQEVKYKTAQEVVWNPGNGEITVSVANSNAAKTEVGDKTQGLAGVQQVVGTSEVSVKATAANATEFKVKSELATSFAATAQGRDKGLGLGHEEERKQSTSYTVTIPNRPGETQIDRAGQAAKINPYDPTTIPEGVTVIKESEAFSKSESRLSYGHFTATDGVTRTPGHSVSVSRTGTVVNVSIADSEKLRTPLGLSGKFDAEAEIKGVKVGTGVGGSVEFGGRYEDKQQVSASFDIATPSGQAAYSHFISTGQIAAKTPGVGSVTTETGYTWKDGFKVETNVKINGAVGGTELELEGKSALSFEGAPSGTTRTQYPDKSFAETYTNAIDAVPVRGRRFYDENGAEIPSQRSYEYEVKLSGLDPAQQKEAAEKLNHALTGRADGPVRPGQDFTLKFDEAQMQALKSRVQAVSPNLEGDNSNQAIKALQEKTANKGSEQFGLWLGAELGREGVGRFADRLDKIAQPDRNGPNPLPPFKLDAAVVDNGKAVAATQAGAATPAPAVAAQPAAPAPAAAPQSDPLQDKIRAGVRGLDQSIGKPWDDHSERLSASALLMAEQKGFKPGDTLQVGLSPANGNVAAGANFFVARSGPGASPDPQANWASMPTRDALAVPADQRQQQVADARQQQAHAPAQEQQAATRNQEEASKAVAMK